MANRIVKNRKSPENESEYIAAYKKANPKANRPDGKDIAAVRAKNGEPGHALMNPSLNRGKDKGYHVGEDFISDKELRSKRR